MCGCGNPAPLAKSTATARGRIAGQPQQYIRGHHARGKTGPAHNSWKGGRWQHRGGYIYVYMPTHPSANRDGYVYEHRVVAEQKLGRYLYAHEKVHHVNHDKTDNRPENLEVMTQREHMLLHHRLRKSQ